MKRWIACMLALTMCLGLLAGCKTEEQSPEPPRPEVQQPEAEPKPEPQPEQKPALPVHPDSLTVYVGGGRDENDGLTGETAVATLARAMEQLLASGPKAGQICLVGNAEVPADYRIPDHSFPLEVWGDGGRLTLKGNLFLGGDTRFHDLEFVNTVSGLRYIVGNCHRFIMGENCVDTPKVAEDGKVSYLNLVGGGYNRNIQGDSHLTVMSGYWRNVYGGSYNGSKFKDMVQTGSATLDLLGGTTVTVTGGVFHGTLTGDITVNLEGGLMEADSDKEGLYPASVYGTVNGNVTVNIRGEKPENILLPGRVTGGSRESGGLAKGSVTVHIQGATLGGGYDADGRGSVMGAVTTTVSGPLALNCELEADEFLGGSLVLGAEGRLEAEKVSGRAEVELTDPVNDQIFAQAPADTPDDSFAVKTAGVQVAVEVKEGVKQWRVISGGGASRTLTLRLTLPQAATSINTADWWYNKSGHSLEAASQSQPQDGYVTYTYENVAPGYYSCRMAADGCYNLCTAFYITEEDLAAGVREVRLELVKGTGSGYQPQTGADANVQRFILPGLAARLTTEGLTMDGKAPFEPIATPAFAPDKNGFQFSTEEDMMAWMENLARDNPDMHIYSAGESTQGRGMPMVLFTQADIPAGATLEEAAAIVRREDKALVQITAGVHGNEPSGSEAALLMMQALCGQYDSTFEARELLKDLNIYFIPRLNPDGLHDHMRRNPANNEDMNRDWMTAYNPEVQNVLAVFRLFLPDMTMDMHEFMGDLTFRTSDEIGTDENGQPYLVHFDDLRITGSSSLNSDPETNKEIVDMAMEAFEELQDCGLRVHDYGATKAHVINHAYFGLHSCYSFLLETRGIALVKSENYQRRVFSHYGAMRSLLRQAAENSRHIHQQVAENRAAMIARGKTYEEDDRLVIYSTMSGESYRMVKRPSFNLDGSYKDEDRQEMFKLYDTASMTRTAPTAYVLPVSNQADTICRSLKEAGAEIFVLPAGGRLPVQQYAQKTAGNDGEMVLREEAETEFPAGAYVIPMDQECAMVIGMMLEIDNKDTSPDYTLLNLRLTAADASGNYPVYRYIRDNPREQLGLSK